MWSYKREIFFYPEIIKISKINNNFFQKNRKNIIFNYNSYIFGCNIKCKIFNLSKRFNPF